jgi:hypothetical protein
VYRLLPLSGGYGGNINHYIVISGLRGDDFVYNDSAFGGQGGRGLLITAEDLETAWATADIPRHAAAFGSRRRGDVPPSVGSTGSARGEADAPLLPFAASVGPRDADAAVDSLLSRAATDGVSDALEVEPAAIPVASAPPDLATVAPQIGLNHDSSDTSLLDAPIPGAPTRASRGPSAPLPSQLPTPELEDADALAAPLTGALAGGLRVAFVLGGVAGLYLMLLAQTALAYLSRRLL